MKKSAKFLILGAVVLASCSSNSTSPIEGVPNPGVHVAFSFLDENGNDLLDLENPEAWGEDNITIYNLIDGEKKSRFNVNMDKPKGFSILYHEEEDMFFMSLNLSEQIDDGYTTTFIEFPNGETDTLKIKAEQKSNLVTRAGKFWYNEKLLFDEEETEYQDLGYFEITKYQTTE